MAITANKLLGKNEKGGALAVQPKSNLVPSKDKGSDITKVESTKESPLSVIRVKVIKIEDILQGTLAAEKKAADDRRKAQEDEDRDEQEEELETPKTKGKGIKLPLPGKIKSWWANIKKFFGTVLLGWLVLKFMKWLPKLKGILSLAVRFFEFFVWIGGHLLNAIVTAVHWGYKAFEWTRDVIGNVFGEGGLRVFDKFANILNKVLNLQFTLTLAMIAFSNEFETNLWDIGKNFIRLFKHGLGPRVLKRALIQTLGKKGAVKVLAGVSKVPVVAAAKVVALVTAASGVSMAVGEGTAMLMKLNDKVTNYSRGAHEKSKHHKWWDPRKYFWGVVAGVSDLAHRVFGVAGGLFDIIGTPFRMLMNLIRMQTAKPEDRPALEEKITNEMMEFDGRLREQFRRFFNIFDIGQLFGKGWISDEKGAWGAQGGKEGQTYGLDRIYQNETLNRKDDSIDFRFREIPFPNIKYDSSVDSTSEEVIYVKKNRMGRSVANNRGKVKEKIVTINVGGGSVLDPYANSYRA